MAMQHRGKTISNPHISQERITVLDTKDGDGHRMWLIRKMYGSENWRITSFLILS
jgi:hypothetical protein